MAIISKISLKKRSELFTKVFVLFWDWNIHFISNLSDQSLLFNDLESIGISLFVCPAMFNYWQIDGKNI